jgi:hypothetical protein
MFITFLIPECTEVDDPFHGQNEYLRRQTLIPVQQDEYVTKLVSVPA